MNQKLLRLLPLLLLPLLLGGCSSLGSVTKGLGIFFEYLIYLAGIALPFVLAYYLSK